MDDPLIELLLNFAAFGVLFILIAIGKAAGWR
jgi:hypothetical protein